jgi:hypothetical protein
MMDQSRDRLAGRSEVVVMQYTRNGRRVSLLESEARELVEYLVEREVPSEVVLSRRFGWVALTMTPWHKELVPLRSWDDVFTLLHELSYTGDWDGFRPEVGAATAAHPRRD